MYMCLYGMAVAYWLMMLRCQLGVPVKHEFFTRGKSVYHWTLLLATVICKVPELI